MNTISDDIQNVIYKYKHQLEFKSVMNELNKSVGLWCEMGLDAMYNNEDLRARHNPRYIYFSNKLKTLNDYEDHLFRNLKSIDILDIINKNY